MNARVLFAVSVLSFVAPAVAAGQAAGMRVSVHGAVGTHINAGGDNQSVSVGFSPHERWDLLINAERSHLPTEVTRFGATRGGTTSFVSGEVRFMPFTHNRIPPYVLAFERQTGHRVGVNPLRVHVHEQLVAGKLSIGEDVKMDVAVTSGRR